MLLLLLSSAPVSGSHEPPIGPTPQDTFTAAVVAVDAHTEELASRAEDYGAAIAQIDTSLRREIEMEVQVLIEDSIEMLDTLEVLPCYQTWWATKRTSLVMLRESVTLLREADMAYNASNKAGDVADLRYQRYQSFSNSAGLASSFLATKAKAERLAADCSQKVIDKPEPVEVE